MGSMVGFQARQRIERLESLLKRALAAAAAASVGFAGPVVANEAAAAAFPLSDVPNGQAQVFVLSHRSIWTKKNGVPGTVGVPPLSPHEVIATTAGTPGVLTRTMYSDPALRIGVNDLFIDPANPAANDENSGLTALVPLKTGYELFRRWGWGVSVIAGPNLATSPDGCLTIHIQSSILDPDSLPVNVIVAANGQIRFKGAAPTIIQPSTALTAVTPMNSATNTRLRLTAGALNWAPFIAPNRRGRILDGAAAGGTFQVQTNVGGGAADCSACQTTNEVGFSLVPTTVTPAIGDHFVIESLVQCNFGVLFEVREEINDTFGGFDAFFNIVDLNLPALPNQNFAPVTPTAGATAGVRINFYNCTIDRTIDLSVGSTQMIACYFFVATFGGLSNLGFLGFNACLAGGGSNSAAGAVYSITFGGQQHEDVMIDNDFIANRPSAFFATGPIRNFASWNSPGFAQINAGAHAVQVGGGGTSAFFAQRGAATFKGRCWGNGGAGVGIQVAAGCDAIGAPQVVTGGSGDFKLADNPPGAGASHAVYWDGPTSVYLPVGGQATTWALLTAAKAAPGFGGSAHWPDQNAHWNASETSA